MTHRLMVVIPTEKTVQALTDEADQSAELTCVTANLQQLAMSSPI